MMNLVKLFGGEEDFGKCHQKVKLGETWNLIPEKLEINGHLVNVFWKLYALTTHSQAMEKITSTKPI
jgi:hypothetical protein